MDEAINFTEASTWVLVENLVYELKWQGKTIGRYDRTFIEPYRVKIALEVIGTIFNFSIIIVLTERQERGIAKYSITRFNKNNRKYETPSLLSKEMTIKELMKNFENGITNKLTE